MTGETEAARLPKLSLGNIVDQGWKGGERKRWHLWSLSPNPQAIHEPWDGKLLLPFDRVQPHAQVSTAPASEKA